MWVGLVEKRGLMYHLRHQSYQSIPCSLVPSRTLVAHAYRTPEEKSSHNQNRKNTFRNIASTER